MILRPAVAADAPAILEIYNHEVLTSNVTFDLTPRTLEDQRRWITDRSGAHAAVVAVDADGGSEVVITYTHGYENPPSSILRGCREFVRSRAIESQSASRTSVSRVPRATRLKRWQVSVCPMRCTRPKRCSSVV